MAAGEADGHGERILIVEDQGVVRMLATEILATHGYIVLSAASAEEATELFDREGGRFDLVFSDVILPDQTGMHLVDALQQRGTFAVLFASGYADEKAHWNAMPGRKHPFLQKPYDTAGLLRAVRNALADARRPTGG